MTALFELKKAKNKKMVFHLLAPNGEIILASQLYASKGTARRGVASVQVNAGIPERYVRKTDKRGQHYFVLRAANNRVIGRSQAYSSATAMEKGIKTVAGYGATDQVVDLSW